MGDRSCVRTTYARRRAEHGRPPRCSCSSSADARKGTVGIHGRHAGDQERISYVSTDGRERGHPPVTVSRRDGKFVDVRLGGPRSRPPPSPTRGEEPDDGLPRLPQPADARVRAAGAGDGQGAGRGPDQPAAPLHKEEGGRSAAGGISGPRDRGQPHCRGASRRSTAPAIPRCTRGSAPPSKPRSPRSRPSTARNVFPDMKVDLGHVPEQPRAHGLQRLLPLPRREPQARRRHDHHPGLHDVPHHPGPGREGPQGPRQPRSLSRRTHETHPTPLGRPLRAPGSRWPPRPMTRRPRAAKRSTPRNAGPATRRRSPD